MQSKSRPVQASERVVDSGHPAQAQSSCQVRYGARAFASRINWDTNKLGNMIIQKGGPPVHFKLKLATVYSSVRPHEFILLGLSYLLPSHATC